MATLLRDFPGRRCRWLNSLMVLLTAWPSPSATACTAFAVDSGTGVLMAKNFDWSSGDGYLVVNERDQIREPLFPAPPGEGQGSWAALYASVSFTVIGPGFPVSGMNEAGLAVEALVNHSVGRPPSPPSEGRLTALEWAQFALDRFRTVSEAVEDVRNRRLTQLGVPLHLLLCDRSGACVAIEPDASGASTRLTPPGRLKVRALANRYWAQDFKESAGKFDRWIARRFSGIGESLPRFATVRPELSRSWRGRDHHDAIGLLDQVEIPGLTKWQLVWNLKDGRVFWRDRIQGRQLNSLRLADLDLACGDAATARVREIGRQPDDPTGRDAPDGPAVGDFRPYTREDRDRVAGRLTRLLVSLGVPGGRPLAERIAAATSPYRCAVRSVKRGMGSGRRTGGGDQP